MPIEGLDAFAATLTKRIPEAVRIAARDEIEKGAIELVAVMKRFVPADEGTLRDSIGYTFGDAPDGSITIGTVGGGRSYGRVAATIYAGSEATMVYNSRGIGFQNAKLQEFGTRGGTPASSYFLGTWRALNKKIKRRITRGVKKAIEETYRNG